MGCHGGYRATTRMSERRSILVSTARATVQRLKGSGYLCEHNNTCSTAFFYEVKFWPVGEGAKTYSVILWDQRFQNYVPSLKSKSFHERSVGAHEIRSFKGLKNLHITRHFKKPMTVNSQLSLQVIFTFRLTCPYSCMPPYLCMYTEVPGVIFSIIYMHYFSWIMCFAISK